MKCQPPSLSGVHDGEWIASRINSREIGQELGLLVLNREIALFAVAPFNQLALNSDGNEVGVGNARCQRARRMRFVLPSKSSVANGANCSPERAPKLGLACPAFGGLGWCQGYCGLTIYSRAGRPNENGTGPGLLSLKTPEVDCQHDPASTFRGARISHGDENENHRSQAQWR